MLTQGLAILQSIARYTLDQYTVAFLSLFFYRPQNQNSCFPSQRKLLSDNDWTENVVKYPTSWRGGFAPPLGQRTPGYLT